jgi:hypothetical protein
MAFVAEANPNAGLAEDLVPPSHLESRYLGTIKPSVARSLCMASMKEFLTLAKAALLDRTDSTRKDPSNRGTLPER